MPSENHGVITHRHFDGFELIRPLGTGGMATVHLARDTSLDRLVAIKFISTAFSDPHARDRLRREAKAIARLQHPNVVAIYRVGDVDDQPYIAYEYIEGRQLDELPRPIDWIRALRIGLGVSRGLAAAHHRGIVHRDLKPANIAFVGNGLRDFHVPNGKILEDPFAVCKVSGSISAWASCGPRRAAIESSEPPLLCKLTLNRGTCRRLHATHALSAQSHKSTFLPSLRSGTESFCLRLHPRA